MLDKEGQLTPEDAVVLGDNLRSAGRLEEAALILERASARTRLSATAALPGGRPHPGAQDDEASAACDQRLEHVPDHIEALRRLGDLARSSRISTPRLPLRSHPGVDAGDVAAMTKLGVVRMRTRAARRGDAPLSSRPSSAIPGTPTPCCTSRVRWHQRDIPPMPCPTFKRALDAGPPRRWR